MVVVSVLACNDVNDNVCHDEWMFDYRQFAMQDSSVVTQVSDENSSVCLADHLGGCHCVAVADASQSSAMGITSWLRGSETLLSH